MERLIEANGGTGDGLDLRWRRDMHGVNLWSVNLHGANLRGANLQGAILAEANLHDANLGHANLQGAALNLTNLQGAHLQLATFQSADLGYADLQGARLGRANLQGADLRGADLRGANLAGVRISQNTELEGVMWDKNYISVLERNGDYEAAIALYRRLKEWYRGAGMLKIAGGFHYREREAQRKAGRQQLWKDIKQIGNEFKEFKGQVALEWRKLLGKDS